MEKTTATKPAKPRVLDDEEEAYVQWLTMREEEERYDTKMSLYETETVLGHFDASTLRTWSEELNQAIPPKRREELKKKAAYDARVYVEAVFLPAIEAIHADYIDESFSYELDAPWNTEDVQEIDNIPQPATLLEQIFLRGYRQRIISDQLEAKYDELTKIIFALTEDKKIRSLICRNTVKDHHVQGDIVGKTLIEKISAFEPQPDPAAKEVGKRIYGRIVSKMDGNDDFETMKNFVLSTNCREGTAFAKEIMSMTKGNKLPTKPTLKKWVQWYIDTLPKAKPEAKASPESNQD